jgi:nucleoside phosphorylase
MAALDSAIKSGASGIISFGVAGGLSPDLVAGDWIIGSAIRTERDIFATDRVWAQRLLEALPGAVHADVVGVDAPVAGTLEKRRLHAETGAVAVDMESHMVGLHHDGTPNIRAVWSSLMQQPSQLSALMRTALDARIARAALRHGRHLLGARLGFP